MFTLGHVNLWTCIFTCTLGGYRKDTGRMPEGYRKGDRRPLGDLLTDPLTGPLTDTLTDPSRSGDLRQAGDSARRRDTGRIPDHFSDLEPWAS